MLRLLEDYKPSVADLWPVALLVAGLALAAITAYRAIVWTRMKKPKRRDRFWWEGR